MCCWNISNALRTQNTGFLTKNYSQNATKLWFTRSEKLYLFFVHSLSNTKKNKSLVMYFCEFCVTINRIMIESICFIARHDPSNKKEFSDSYLFKNCSDSLIDGIDPLGLLNRYLHSQITDSILFFNFS